MQNEHLRLYNINIKYIRDLSNADDKVLSVSPQIKKEKRPWVGVIVICGKKEYCVPLSSPKPKHENMKNDKDFLRIISNDGKLIGVLNFNLMIPVNQSLISMVDLHIYKNDSQKLAAYKHLMKDQLKWCNDNSDNIIKKANKLYEFVTKTPEKSYNLTHRCCDFKKLEAVLEKWLEKEFEKCNAILAKNPTLKEKLDAATVEYNRKHNLTSFGKQLSLEERVDRRKKLLVEYPALKIEYEKAEMEFDNNLTHRQNQTSPKPKHRR